MQRKRKFLLWIPVLVLLCAAFTVFCAADETAESTDSATFIFITDNTTTDPVEVARRTYKVGDELPFSFDLEASKQTFEIDLHNFYAQFTSATFIKDGAEESQSVSELPTTITVADCGEYVITLKGKDVRKVYASIIRPAKNMIAYLANVDAFIGASTLNDAIVAGEKILITFHENGSLPAIDFTKDNRSGATDTATDKKPIVYIDFNGQSLNVSEQVNTLFNFKTANGNSYVNPHYFYSSRPGAQITATNATFLRGARNCAYYIGSVDFTMKKFVDYDEKISVQADGANLSIACRALYTVDYLSGHCYADGITYRQTTPNNTTGNKLGALCYVAGGEATNNPTLEITNSTLYLENGSFSATASSAITAGLQSALTIKDSRMYLRSGVTYRNNATYEKSSIELVNTEIYSADKLGSLVENKLFARCDRATEGRITYLYQWVDSDKSAKATLVDGDENPLFAEAWVIGATPVFEYNPFGDRGTYTYYATADEPISADKSYLGTLKSSASKITGNLTLYANITFNLYFKADTYITGVTYTHPNGETKIDVTFEEKDLVTLSDGDYYLFKIDNISPKNLSEAFTLDVHLEKDGTTATYTVSTSLSKYASSVLKDTNTDDKTKAGKNLVLALLDYVYEMSIAFKDESDTDTAGLDAIKKGLGYYGYTRETWEGPGTIPTPGNITAASLKLASTPGFIFFLSSDYEKTNEINVTVNGTETDYTVTHDGDNHYFIVSNIHVSKYNEDLTVKVEGGEAFVYNLDAYMQGFIKKGEEVPAYAHALYSYVLAAQAYLATPDTQVTE